MLNNNPGPATNEMIILPIDEPFQLSNPPYEADSGTMPGSPAILGTLQYQYIIKIEMLSNQASMLLGQANFLGGYNNSGFYMFGGQISNSTSRTEVKW